MVERFRRMSVAVVLGVSAVVPLAASAQRSGTDAGPPQACDAVVPASGSSIKYAPRENRCEGFYQANVGAQLELVSLVFGRVDYRVASKVVLRVTVPQAADTTHVRGVAIPARTYYQMDAILRRGTELNWPIDAVLAPAGLGPSEIGVFAWSGAEGSRTFYPVSVQEVGRPAAGMLPVTFAARVPVDVSRVFWRSAASPSGACVGQYGAWHAVLSSDRLMGQTISFPLAALQGPQCIEVQAETANTPAQPWVSMSVRVILPGQ